VACSTLRMVGRGGIVRTRRCHFFQSDFLYISTVRNTRIFQSTILRIPFNHFSFGKCRPNSKIKTKFRMIKNCIERSSSALSRAKNCIISFFFYLRHIRYVISVHAYVLSSVTTTPMETNTIYRIFYRKSSISTSPFVPPLFEEGRCRVNVLENSAYVSYDVLHCAGVRDNENAIIVFFCRATQNEITIKRSRSRQS